MTEKETAIAAAIAAGNLMKRYIGKITSGDIDDKNPFDFVTVIDKKAEELIINLIAGNFLQNLLI